MNEVTDLTKPLTKTDLSHRIDTALRKISLLNSVESKEDLPDEFKVDVEKLHTYAPNTLFDEPVKLSGTEKYLEPNKYDVQFPINHLGTTFDQVLEDIQAEESKMAFYTIPNPELLHYEGSDEDKTHIIISFEVKGDKVYFAVPFFRWVNFRGQNLATRSFFDMAKVPLEFCLRSDDSLNELNLGYHLKNSAEKVEYALVFDSSESQEFVVDPEVQGVKPFKVNAKLALNFAKGKTTTDTEPKYKGTQNFSGGSVTDILHSLANEIRVRIGDDSTETLVPVRYLCPQIAQFDKGEFYLRAAIVPSKNEKSKYFGRINADSDLGESYPGFMLGVTNFFNPYKRKVRVKPLHAQKGCGNAVIFNANAFKENSDRSLPDLADNFTYSMSLYLTQMDSLDALATQEQILESCSHYQTLSVDSLSDWIPMDEFNRNCSKISSFSDKKGVTISDSADTVLVDLVNLLKASSIPLTWAYSDSLSTYDLSDFLPADVVEKVSHQANLVKFPNKLIQAVLAEYVADVLQKEGKIKNSSDFINLFTFFAQSFDAKTQDLVESLATAVVGRAMRSLERGSDEQRLFDKIASKLYLRVQEEPVEKLKVEV